MSLINDALKRAEAAQQHTPPPAADHLPLRPVDPQVVVTHGVGLAMPLVFAAMALLLLFFAWRFYMDSHRAKDGLAVAARAETNQEVLTQSSPEPVPSTSPVASTPAPQPAPVPSLAPTSATAPAPVPNTTSATATNLATSPAPTNQAVTSDPPAPKLLPLKLQGVVYSKNRPSAVINGKTVFLGDKVREFRVIGIGLDTVVLGATDRTNVLVLSD